MRDLIITLVVFGLLPFILARPYIGVLTWSWLGYMNPHRLAYGFAYNFPFSMLVALATMASLLFNREPKRVPIYPLTVVWILFVCWMSFTTLFALVPADAGVEWERMIKIQLMVLITLVVITDKSRLYSLIWVIVLSLGFYGIKGGMFSIATGGNYTVFGPEDSFFRDNNALALVLVMIIPLMRYLQLLMTRAWVRYGMYGAMLLTAASIISSYSRGAFLAIVAMGAFLIWKSRKKFMLILLVATVVPASYYVIPQKWYDRMDTIQSYDKDASAVGRLNAWGFAFNVAKDKPFTGGGFNVFDRELFKIYAENPNDFHDAHSIYFEVLGEHGFIGLGLFLLLGALAVFTGFRIQRLTKGHANLIWAYDLAAMIQVSLVGYAIGGAFLGLAYFDLYYHLISLLIITRMLVEKELGIYGKTMFTDSMRQSDFFPSKPATAPLTQKESI